MNIVLNPDITSDVRERDLILGNSRGICDAVVVAMLNTFSRREAKKKLMRKGFSKTTAKLLVVDVLNSPEARSDLAELYKSRTTFCFVMSLLLGACYFIPDVPTLLVKLTAISLVYGIFSAVGWLRYSRTRQNPFRAR